MPPRILFIVTSHARLGDTGKPTGVWAEELAVPYYALTAAGASVDFASPAGGPVPIDPGSLPATDRPPVIERFLADSALQARFAATPRVAEIEAAAWDAVFFPGGHGTMWDLPVDAGVTRAIETAWGAGKVVAAVCHGPAGLVAARRPDGRPLVEGLEVSAFTDAEEDAVGLSGVVPFKLESRLRELGAHFRGTHPWQPFAVRDGRLITGQNPQSSHLVAELLANALGLTAPKDPAGP